MHKTGYCRACELRQGEKDVIADLQILLIELSLVDNAFVVLLWQYFLRLFDCVFHKIPPD